jgi:hypothetical protein
MELKHFFPRYPQISVETTRNFNGLITSKGEFADLKLQSIEDTPDYGGFYNSQKIIRNYMNGYSPYTNLLLLHKMGSGKTCTAIAVAEHLIKINRVKKVIILCRGEKLVQSFQKEMVMNCTGGKYIPDDVTDMTIFYKQSKKLFKRWYTFSTYYKFANKLQKYASSDYEGCLFILDEVHNMKDDEGTSVPANFDVYAEIHELLVKKLKNRMCLLLSGTPMMNSATEIAGVLNLLNPPDLQLGPGWEKEYLNKHQVFMRRMYLPFSRYTRGKVSYLDNMIDIHVQINHIGTPIHPTAASKFNVVMLTMSDYQTRVYMDAYKDSDQAKLWLRPRQLSNMAPAETTREMVQDLDKYSVKFKTIMESIQKNRAKNTFIFSTFIQYGIHGIQEVLEYNGYTQTTMRNAETPGLKYAVITSETPAGYSRFIVDVFNRDENKNGELIHVLIGSESISEGFSFKNVQHIHILNPHWNYGKIEQAIYRGIRLNSHKALGPVDVDIFKYVALPNTPTSQQDSIDLQMYSVSEKKDVSIVSVEKQLAKTSFDCILFQERNNIKACECNDWHPRDESTQDIYHLDDYKSPIVDFIYSRLRVSNSLDITTLPFSPFKVASVVNNMLMKNKTVRNKYGFQSSLILEGNLIRIVSNTMNPEPFYNDNMIMVSKMLSVQEISETMNRKDWTPAMTDHEKKSMLQTLNVKQQAEIVETYFQDPFIGEYYKDYIFVTMDEVYFHNIKAAKGPFRILAQDKWRNSRKDEYEDFNDIVIAYFHDTYKNKSGVYGIQPFDKNKSIKLRDLDLMIVNSHNKGLSIVSCKKPYLNDLVRIMIPDGGEGRTKTIKQAAEIIIRWLGDNKLIFYELF